MAKSPALKHGLIDGNVHFAIVKEGARLQNMTFSQKKMVTNLYLYYKDMESMPCQITDANQISDDEWLGYKAKAFKQDVDKLILDGNG